ncbi:site-specific DNA-methyltransferase [Paracoccus sp. (in: a-proteobacteria)]|uniref:site-specific DNA-methyltransferase n=1 Tax=Paracoccus sp. TaxID=267 RepID=UPI0026E049FD|nr:site-specific DNA-methyltransferase [Paracoccus sp. (in: a-proteobacteria)]MDO5646334.1 site-specific DNA-methyltransferase [Paracoccus sp. (in: a-proteobacteria)]
MPEIKKLVLDDPATKSADIVAGNVDALKALFPDAFKEGSIDFDVLRQLLGGAVDEKDEKYGLNWHGKRQARQIALTPSTGTLLPCPDESVDWDTTQNLMIEGDNLEVLKLLQKSYAGKVKLIYIDPPYNTGKDFVYPDDFQDSIKNYLRLTGQINEGGARASSNTEASGRFHTDWLNMMYPRLKLARNLLAEDGAIFISLDDSEQASAKRLCDEIFGEENFVATIVWEKVHTRKNSSRYFSTSHDYVLCIAKSKPDWPRPLLPRDNTNAYSNPDNHPKGPWKLDPITAHNPYSAEYTITKPNGVVLRRPQGRYWAFSEDTINEKIADDAIVWGAGDSYPMIKRFLSEVQDGLVPITIFHRKFAGDTAMAKGEVDDLFGVNAVFDYPKPTRLIERLLQIGSRDSDIILDFFAGSGTTGHAVMAQNAADGGKRRYILVQLPQPLDPAKAEQKIAAEFCDSLNKPRSIAELTKERLRRAAAAVKANAPEFDGDLGFRVFKLSPSNIVAWEPEPSDLEGTLLANTEHLVPGRTEQDVLYELLLKLGLDLCVPIEKKDIAGKAVHSIGGGALIVCLADGLTTDTVENVANGIVAWWTELAPAVDTRVVFKDSGFADDVAKTNMAAILNQNGILDVRSL